MHEWKFLAFLGFKPRNRKRLTISLVSVGIFLLVIGIPTSISFYQHLPQESPELITLDENGHLIYHPYANHGEDNAVNYLPDFSFAGYRGGGVTLPNASVQVTLSPAQGDDRERIQDAIDQVAALPLDVNGLRGAVLLTEGSYHVEGSLFLNTSGVVLRGKGQGMDGTVLTATSDSQHDFIFINGSGTELPQVLGSQRSISSEYIPTGTIHIQVNSTQGYSVGDSIGVVRTPNQHWIDTLEMAQYGWTKESYTILHERTVTGIEEYELVIDIPIIDPINSIYGGGYVCKTDIAGRISRCGIENLRLLSSYDINNVSDEDHAWKAIVLHRTTDSWVKQVTAQYFGYACVSIEEDSKFNTVQDCAMLDPISQTIGARKYSFNIAGGAGLGNLFQRCFTRGGRHDFVTGSRITGPNVWLDCLAIDTHSDIGPHHRWTTGTLFDNVMGGQTRVRNRGASGTGHGWAGAQTMFWHVVVPKDEIMVTSPEGAINWAVGCSARSRTGASGYWVSWKDEVTPRSLYLAQLNDRLGEESVIASTVPEQVDGTIWDGLEVWQGEGTPPWLI